MAANSRSPRDGEHLEVLGYYNPLPGLADSGAGKAEIAVEILFFLLLTLYIVLDMLKLIFLPLEMIIMVLGMLILVLETLAMLPEIIFNVSQAYE
ncbi:30S ribosomal S16-2, chloroplastic mitochondrial-like [Olea europaea subsp. europaea]|uniref:30S ribosomal S16-2, chloroplastic mitochondrial-like n=1 Tax=Olea europaea subsp. europaea TaxID=158383 RepID=A0A8S0P6B1_OLEEU|nr:30S ribosomal S16-2, chloroplastic mitochondrial-like [Olea europaea subsp. europaea]